MDQNDRRIAVIPKPGAIPFREREANLHLIETAPELLAALLEAAYHLDRQGTPLRPELYDLINRARGPEFRPLKPQTPNAQPADATPKQTPANPVPKRATADPDTV